MLEYLKKNVNKVFYDYRYYGLFLEPDEQLFKTQVFSKLKIVLDKLYKEVDRIENDIKVIEGVPELIRRARGY